MGTTGSGRFGSYEHIDRTECPKNIVFNLEDFDTLEYMNEIGILPEVGQEVFICGELINKRLVVVDKKSELVLGNVPVMYNYLYSRCITNGISYTGIVVSISNSPINLVMVELND